MGKRGKKERGEEEGGKRGGKEGRKASVHMIENSKHTSSTLTVAQAVVHVYTCIIFLPSKFGCLSWKFLKIHQPSSAPISFPEKMSHSLQAAPSLSAMASLSVSGSFARISVAPHRSAVFIAKACDCGSNDGL